MNVTLTNLGTIAVPYSSPNDKGFAALLEPGVPVSVSATVTTVVNVGDNPDALEELAEGLQNILDKLVKLVTFWRERVAENVVAVDDVVKVSIENHGPNALRVLLGANTNDVEVGVGMTYPASAAGYVEIRELGV